jgi:precorrin-4 methylase
MDQGKNVAILDYGDLTIWSGSEYLREYLASDIIDIIPGLSSFNVASAMLKKHTGCNGSIILTNSRGILDNKPLFRAAAKNGETLCVFMAIRDLREMAGFLKDAYETETPVHIIYRAGYSAKEKIVRTNLDGLTGVINEEKEKHLFLLFIGPCLNSAKAHRH